MLLLFFASVLMAAAVPPDALEARPSVEFEGSVPVLPAPLSQADLLDEAVALRRVGAFSDASALLALAATRTGDVDEQVAYQQGVLTEVTEQWMEAIAAYARVAESYSTSPTAADARFRRAYCLEELGEHKAATKAVAALQREGVWSEADRQTMQLQRGITELRAGRRRVGIKRILSALDDGGPTERSWIAAKARLALVRAQLEAAARITLKGNKRAAKRLKKRSGLISAAEKQAIVMFGLSEPEFALEGLSMLGDAYLELYDDMVSYAPPRSIKADQQATYREVVAQKAAILRIKAHARFDEGMRVAARTAWVGSVTERLRKKREAVAVLIEAEPSNH